MPSELDQKYEAVLAAVSGEGGRIVIGPDARGRPTVANFPPTLPMMFMMFAQFYADHPYVISGEEKLTYAEINALTDKIAKGLVARGIEKGDRVAIAMRNCTSWIAAYMGVVKAGGVATLINGWWREEELRHALELTAPRLIIADAPRAAMARGLGHGDSTLDIDIDQPVETAMAALLGAADETALPQVTPDDDATILFTSGSTGKAKGALSTHGQVVQGTYTYVVSLMVLRGILESEGRPVPEQMRALVSVPLFHVTGEVPVMLTSYVIDRALVLMPKWDAELAMQLIEKEKVTVFTGVPTMALELMTHPNKDNYDLSSLGDINSGGAARPAAHLKRQEEDLPGTRSIQGYGLTETNAVGCGNFWQNYKERPTSVGRPQMPFVEIAILGDDGKRLPAGQTGEIAIRSAATIKGYWGDEEATAAAYTDDGFFRTGDIGYLDEEDYLYIVDRMKNIIIRGGENIAAAEVEEALYAHPAVAEAVVLAKKDERLGEVPFAIVSCPEGGCDAEDLRSFCGERLAAFKVPEEIVVADTALPRLGTGKVDRIALAKQYRD
ncbi:class I adenylate-forming enzyme family protein [Sphingomicrobium astaxanthinifaciens]|uniref:class I adenylate-forming enzyme family protein n=1 Tax=Sphingomicrobium astaxanthinifaciens TaxID=1227949 RepID=UPI001FCB6719|nr:class I adenylate-forming enzyme family protein [Sphingomicrobium astaxanthinifaciens]MCJ7421448.1 acyl--CoA ligase [Sphingomicrobium astaxanthinifaciens]